jgi:hypothetical protein
MDPAVANRRNALQNSFNPTCNALQARIRPRATHLSANWSRVLCNTQLARTTRIPQFAIGAMEAALAEMESRRRRAATLMYQWATEDEESEGVDDKSTALSVVLGAQGLWTPGLHRIGLALANQSKRRRLAALSGVLQSMYVFMITTKPQPSVDPTQPRESRP